MTRSELTERRYWDDQWRRLRASGQYASSRWIARSYVYTALDGLFRSVLPADPERTFIELGSGPARWLIYFHKTFGYRVSGCDYSEASCELGRKNLADAGVPGTIACADFFQIQGQYDVVFSAGVIEHFREPDTVLRAFGRLLAPGGTLITDVPNLGGLNGLYRKLLKPETFETHRPITLTELRRWHRALGLVERLGTCYGSICLSRVPSDAFRRFPFVQRFLWAPVYRVASGGINRACLFLHRLGVRIDNPLISPHLLVIARKPGGTER